MNSGPGKREGDGPKREGSFCKRKRTATARVTKGSHEGTREERGRGD